MSNKPLDKVDERYAIELGRTLFSEAYKIIATESDKRPRAFEGLASMTFLADAVCTFVYHFVNENAKSGMSAEDAIEAYKKYKQSVEEAVAVGFQSAMEKYSGKTVEYYAQIRIVPEPVNKEYPC